MEEKLLINEALEYLKNKEILYFSKSNKRKFFKYINDRVLVIEENTQYKLSIDDFKELFKDEAFFIYDHKDDELVDLKKDEEYYSFKHK